MEERDKGRSIIWEMASIKMVQLVYARGYKKRDTKWGRIRKENMNKVFIHAL